MSAQAAVARFQADQARPRILAEAFFADGAGKQLVATGARFSVVRIRPDATPFDTLIETPHSEVASSYLPRGTHGNREAKAATVWAAGATPEDCVRGFLDSIGNTLKEGSLEPYDEDGPKDEFQWGVRFADAETGTFFKAAGRFVPGGAVLTWWK